jgi:tetratricopeptide (TPR) repeat protein
MANLRNAQQKYREAIEEIQRAIALGPNRADSYLTLALVKTKIGRALPDTPRTAELPERFLLISILQF